MHSVDEVAREMALAVLARSDWTLSALESHFRAAFEQDRRTLILECCRAACEDCARTEPERVEEEGTAYYLHRPQGLDLLIECRSGDIRASFLEP